MSDVFDTADPTPGYRYDTERGTWVPDVKPRTCRHCGRAITLEDHVWVDPSATGDDAVWRETCDSHDTFEANHEPANEGRPAAIPSAELEAELRWTPDVGADYAPTTAAGEAFGIVEPAKDRSE